jgi:hypothetical protein
VVNEEYYSKDGSTSPEERAELQRIQQERSAEKLSVGMVRAYVLGPDGHTYDVGATDTATTTLASLGRAVAQFKPQPRNPVVTPRPQSVSPPAAADAVTLHLISRGDDRGSWGAFPAESWIVLDRGDWSKLLPTAAVSPGQTWGLDQDVSARILTYPGRKDAQPIEAQVVGLLIFAPGQPPTLELTTTRAVHRTRTFTVAVRTAPHPPR